MFSIPTSLAVFPTTMLIQQFRLKLNVLAPKNFTKFRTRRHANKSLSNMRVASLRVASLRVASLRVASLRVASLRVASLRVASCESASLRVASLRVASLRVYGGDLLPRKRSLKCNFVCFDELILYFIL